jgi:hypothetical protein
VPPDNCHPFVPSSKPGFVSRFGKVGLGAGVGVGDGVGVGVDVGEGAISKKLMSSK